MPDVHDPATRSRNMAAVRGKDTKPELLIRSQLHRMGFRYRLHDRSLPGHPDLVFAKYGAVVFVHGCFWHRHSCPLFKLPASRREFWDEKLGKNAERDRAAEARLREAGWRVGVVWECALRGRSRLADGRVAERLSGWLTGNRSRIVIEGA